MLKGPSQLRPISATSCHSSSSGKFLVMCKPAAVKCEEADMEGWQKSFRQICSVIVYTRKRPSIELQKLRLQSRRPGCGHGHQNISIGLA